MIKPEKIFLEYFKSVELKASIGPRGMFEQNLINERFYIGDQWHGVKCGSKKPLVRHNIIKRIGDYKMSQVLGNPIKINFSADGIPNTVGLKEDLKIRKKDISSDKSFEFEGCTDSGEVNLVMSALSDYFNVTTERIQFNSICEKALRNAYITGTAVVYTYWDKSVSTGLYADEKKTVPVSGDIKCEVLDIENVTFGDPYTESIEDQPYIIISGRKPIDEVINEAIFYGATSNDIKDLENSSEDGKIMVLTRLSKEYKNDGSYTINCIRVTENKIIRPLYDTFLNMYPLSIFRWEQKNNFAYGESEITYLIPNQIALNRMITANVWASMTMGMPMMVVNGDTVTDKITNDPGQIVTVFGSNEDVAGAIKYVDPPTFSETIDKSVNSLIENTLTQSGANQVALGDSKADNASALETMRDAAVMPLKIIKNRFDSFIEQTARIWADFWITYYGNRRIKISDENGVWYMPFDAKRYKQLVINAVVDTSAVTSFSIKDRIEFLNSLFDKGMIDKRQYLKRLPKGIVENREDLITLLAETEDENERV